MRYLGRVPARCSGRSGEPQCRSSVWLPAWLPTQPDVVCCSVRCLQAQYGIRRGLLRRTRLLRAARTLVVMPDSDERKSPMDGNNLKCSFCGKTQPQVDMLIAVPGVAICIECIDLCNEIIADARARGDIPPRSPGPPAGSRSWEIRPPA